MCQFRKCSFLSDFDAAGRIFQENEPVEIFNISFESTQNKQQYGPKIICTEVRKKFKMITNILQLS